MLSHCRPLHTPTPSRGDPSYLLTGRARGAWRTLQKRRCLFSMTPALDSHSRQVNVGSEMTNFPHQT